jgi:hypothetical protein
MTPPAAAVRLACCFGPAAAVAADLRRRALPIGGDGGGVPDGRGSGTGGGGGGGSGGSGGGVRHMRHMPQPVTQCELKDTSTFTQAFSAANMRCY